MSTSRVVTNLYEAPNTLTQRMEGPTCSGAIMMDVSKMLDGRVVNVYPLKGEIAMTEWLGGTIEIDGDQAWHRKKSDSKLQLLK